MKLFLAICIFNCFIFVYGYIGINDNSMDANAAEEYCLTNFNSHLASIHSQSEQNEVYSICNTLSSSVGKYCLIGFKVTEGTWVWRDNTSVVYTNWLSEKRWGDGSLWLPQQPDNNNNDQCAYMYQSVHNAQPNIAAHWFDAHCIGVNTNHDPQPFICNDSPTNAPTDAPTELPTHAPSSTPTLAPSSAPTAPPTGAPSMAPSSSPTACLDYDTQYNSNDGVNELNVSQVANTIDFAHHTSMVVNLTETASNTGSDIFLNETALELQCHGVVSCLQTRIFCAQNQPTCNILCTGYLSCSQAIIYANYTQHVHVICNGEWACLLTHIYANVTTQVTIDCVASASCKEMHIALEQNDYNLISCYLPNACDDIEIHTSNYNDTTLRMYSHSNNVVLSNGYGLSKEDKGEQIDCNTDNKYIRYHSGLNLTEIESRVLNEYNHEMFPCDGVTILCQQNTTGVIDRCTVDYSMLHVTPPMPHPQCYWISITDLVNIHCPGTCLHSPTTTPTKAPSLAPTEPTIIPTNAPSNPPTNTPSLAPTQPPSLAPSATPTLAPSSTPTQPPTRIPSLSPSSTPSFSPTETPTRRPSRTPTLTPTISPTLTPTRTPTLPPSLAPSSPPSLAPTLAPTLTPSITPTLTPTLTPSLAPTLAPSLAPSIHPTFTPTHAPTRSPTNAPTAVPSLAPTFSPSTAPTRGPTAEVDLPYWIDIIYELRHYTETNLHLIVNDSVGFVEAMQEICQMHYFPAVSTYTGYMVQIMDVNGVAVVRREDEANKRRMAEEKEDEKSIEIDIEIDDLYSFQLQQPIQLISQIFAQDENIAGSIITRSKAYAFSKEVQTDIRDYFDNDAITFNINDVDALEALDRLPPPPVQTEW
eukprot:799233_1